MPLLNPNTITYLDEDRKSSLKIFDLKKRKGCSNLHLTVYLCIQQCKQNFWIKSSTFICYLHYFSLFISQHMRTHTHAHTRASIYTTLYYYWLEHTHMHYSTCTGFCIVFILFNVLHIYSHDYNSINITFVFALFSVQHDCFVLFFKLLYYLLCIINIKPFNQLMGSNIFTYFVHLNYALS